MKTYKDFGKVNLGYSDIASLVLRGSSGMAELHFGGDDAYSAYLVTERIDIPDHYKFVFTTFTWLWVYDDRGVSIRINAPTISVYRAGDYGCIIYAPNMTRKTLY